MVFAFAFSSPAEGVNYAWTPPSPVEGVKLCLDRVVVRFCGVHGTGSCPAHLCNYARTIVSLLKEQDHPQEHFALLAGYDFGAKKKFPCWSLLALSDGYRV